jgi:hypothetical protein
MSSYTIQHRSQYDIKIIQETCIYMQYNSKILGGNGAYTEQS